MIDPPVPGKELRGNPDGCEGSGNQAAEHGRVVEGLKGFKFKLQGLASTAI